MEKCTDPHNRKALKDDQNVSWNITLERTGGAMIVKPKVKVKNEWEEWRGEEGRRENALGSRGRGERKRAKQKVQKVQTKRSETLLLPPGNPNVPARIRVRHSGPATWSGRLSGEGPRPKGSRFALCRSQGVFEYS